MNKILKITLISLTLISVILLTSVNCFAFYQDDLASYGSVFYDEYNSSDEFVSHMSIPICVDDTKPYYSRYINGANKTWVSYNDYSGWSRIRCTLPASGMNGYVSSAYNVQLRLALSYNAYDIFSSHYTNNYVFHFDQPYTWDDTNHLYIDVDVLDSSSHEVLESFNYEFDRTYQITINDMPDLNRYSLASYDFVFYITLDYPELSDMSDFSFLVPQDYTYSPLGFNAGYDSGYDDGYDDGVDTHVNFFEFVGSAVNAFLSIEIFPDFTFGILLVFLLAVSFLGIVAKLLAGG